MLAFVHPGAVTLDGFQVNESISITEDGIELSFPLPVAIHGAQRQPVEHWVLESPGAVHLACESDVFRSHCR